MMASGKVDKLWELMEEFKFKVPTNVSDNVVCNKCEGLMIDPYSTECGCQFCMKCISDYLGNSKKCCPGARDYCKDTILEFKSNVVIDYRAANAIKQVNVKCPNELCSFECMLKSMYEHIRCCKMRPMPCPYQMIGCEELETTGENMHVHLQNSALDHSLLLMEALNHLKNDIGGINPNNDDSDSRIRELKTELENVRLEIARQKQEIDELKHAHNVQQNVTKQKYSDNEKQFKEEINKLKQAMEVSIKNLALKKEVEDLKKQLDGQNQVINNIAKSPSTESDRSQTMLNVMYDSVWKIPDFTKKTGERFSEKFSSNNYNLCLRSWLGRDNLFLFLCVQRGAKDASLKWPMRQIITLAVVNQETLRPYIAERYSADTYNDDLSVFLRPTNDSDCRIGKIQLSLAEIKAVRGLLVRDTLLVCCSLSPPIC